MTAFTIPIYPPLSFPRFQAWIFWGFVPISSSTFYLECLGLLLKAIVFRRPAISSKHGCPLRPCLGQLTLNLIAAGRRLSGSPNTWQFFFRFFSGGFLYIPHTSNLDYNLEIIVSKDGIFSSLRFHFFFEIFMRVSGCFLAIVPVSLRQGVFVGFQWAGKQRLHCWEVVCESGRSQNFRTFWRWMK